VGNIEQLKNSEANGLLLMVNLTSYVVPIYTELWVWIWTDPELLAKSNPDPAKDLDLRLDPIF
jgi:hypothetical protein